MSFPIFSPPPLSPPTPSSSLIKQIARSLGPHSTYTPFCRNTSNLYLHLNGFLFILTKGEGLILIQCWVYEWLFNYLSTCSSLILAISQKDRCLSLFSINQLTHGLLGKIDYYIAKLSKPTKSLGKCWCWAISKQGSEHIKTHHILINLL